jgi:hypothetical protein
MPEERLPRTCPAGERTMDKFYKRSVSLMDQRIFPWESLDKPIGNPDKLNSIPVYPVNQSDQEIVDYVVSDLKRTPIVYTLED